MELDQEFLNAMPKKSFTSKMQFVKAMFELFSDKEMTAARNIAQRMKRKHDEAKGRRILEAPEYDVAETVHTPDSEQPVTALHPPQDLQPTQPWWKKFKRTQVVAIDCEMVQQWNPVTQKNHHVVATVAICDYKGDKLYQAKARRDHTTYTTTPYTQRLNGIGPYTLEKGNKTPEEIKREVEEIIKGKLIIGHAVFGDFQCMDIIMGLYDVFDLQWHYYRKHPITRQEMPYSLKALVQHYFPQDKFQEGVHNELEDARYTLKVFMHGYRQDKKDHLDRMDNPNSLTDDDIPSLSKVYVGPTAVKKFRPA